MELKGILVLTFLHFATDLNQGALPALLPFFKENLGLSYTVAGSIVLFSNLFSSVVQPLFGYLADRKELRWLLPLAPLIAAAGIGLSGLVGTFLFLIPLVALSGVGVALFHPEAFKSAYLRAGDRKATGVSLFAFGGSLGIAVGPVYALMAVSLLGLKGTLALFLPATVGAVLVSRLHWTSMVRTTRKAQEGPRAPLTKEQKVAFALLALLSIIRAWSQFGIASYIPFYWIDYLRGEPVLAGKLTSTFLISGALGTLVGGTLADRFGHKRFLLVSLLLSTPLLQLFFYVKEPWLFLVLAVAGAVLISSFGTTTVMGQTLLPQHIGMASGVMVGLTISTGGLGLILLGAIADRWGPLAALRATTFLPLLAFVIGLFVRYPRRTG